jgi:hypothetical protein
MQLLDRQDKFFNTRNICSNLITFKFESLKSLPIPTAHLYINANNLTILILPTGTGAIVGSINIPSRKEPIIVGKPNSVMFDLLKKEHNLDPSRCMMVGDRLV